MLERLKGDIDADLTETNVRGWRRRALIGAGSVLTKPVPAGAVAFGTPATVRRVMEPAEAEVEGAGPRS